jgi:hypothetical protein
MTDLQILVVFLLACLAFAGYLALCVRVHA